MNTSRNTSDHASANSSTLTLGSTTYRVTTQTFAPEVATGTITWLHGPGGGTYYLEPRSRTAVHTGVHRVVSFTTGAPLYLNGRQVHVTVLGDVIERAPYC